MISNVLFTRSGRRFRVAFFRCYSPEEMAPRLYEVLAAGFDPGFARRFRKKYAEICVAGHAVKPEYVFEVDFDAGTVRCWRIGPAWKQVAEGDGLLSKIRYQKVQEIDLAPFATELERAASL